MVLKSKMLLHVIQMLRVLKGINITRLIELQFKKLG